MKRRAFDIRFRCTLNGCDWTARLWLRSEDDAFEAMYRRVPYTLNRARNEIRYSKDFYRVVSCELSQDQETRGVK